MGLRGILVALIVLATVGFVIGTSVERHQSQHESAATLKSEGRAPAAHVEGRETPAAHAAEGGPSGRATDRHPELKPLGVNVEAVPVRGPCRRGFAAPGDPCLGTPAVARRATRRRSDDARVLRPRRPRGRPPIRRGTDGAGRTRSAHRRAPRRRGSHGHRHGRRARSWRAVGDQTSIHLQRSPALSSFPRTQVREPNLLPDNPSELLRWRRRESNPRPRSRRRWRLRAYPALCSRPGIASPARSPRDQPPEDVPGSARAGLSG